MARVTIIGNPGWDTLVFPSDGQLPDLTADGYYSRNVDTVGHAGGFTARALARLGHATTILGSVGEDDPGARIREVLQADGVDVSPLFTDPTGTARSVNLVSADGRRVFFYDGGAHMDLEPPAENVKAALDGSELVMCSLANWARQVLPLARERRVPIAVDLQDVRDPADAYRADFIRQADVLFASAAHVPDLLAAARLWMGMGRARTVVFGMGSQGALLVTHPERTSGGIFGLVHQPPPESRLPVVDTTGAGDTLAAAFLDGVFFGHLDEVAALRRAQLAARQTASKVGGDGLPTAADLEASHRRI